MTILDFSDFRAFLQHYLASQPKKGHGMRSRWAQEFRVSTTLLSQILKGSKSLSPELTEAWARALSLSDPEIDYFLLLTEFDRAGTKSLRDRLKKKILDVQNQARFLKNRTSNSKELSPEVKAAYYSSWMYAGIRNLACCEKQTLEKISDRLHLPRETVAEVVSYLLQNQLLQESTSGWEPGTKSTYLPPDSPLVNKHHQNWRVKSLQAMDLRHEENLFYTSPMSLSASAAKQLRKRLVDVIEEIHEAADPTASEVVYCLNLDWFQY